MEQQVRAGVPDVGVQGLRGLAVVLMVSGHVIGDDLAHGMQVSDASAWRLFGDALVDLRMPLFTVLSGFAYGCRPVSSPTAWGALLTGKVRRLLVPLLVVGAALYAAKLVLPGVNTRPQPGGLWRVYAFGFEHLWFLQALFLIFLVTGALGALGLISTRRSWAVALLLTGTGFVVVQDPSKVFAVDGALRLLPFFLLGYGLRRFQPTVRMLPLAAAFALAYPVRLYGTVVDAEWDPHATRALSLIVGVTGVTLLFQVRRCVAHRALVRVGTYSYGIYLLHVFGAGASLQALQPLDAPMLAFAASITAGVALPVAFELLLGRYAVVSWAVLGQKPRRRAQLRRPTRPAPSVPLSALLPAPRPASSPSWAGGPNDPGRPRPASSPVPAFTSSVVSAAAPHGPAAPR